MRPEFDQLETPIERGITVIEASAGTGKTYTIATLYLRLLLLAGEEIEARQILVTTFTEAATAELRGRVRARLTEAVRHLEGEESPDKLIAGLTSQRSPDEALARLRRALRDFDEAAIHTIHGFCRRVLVDRSMESGVTFDAELLTDDSDLVREVTDDYWRLHFYNAPIPSGALAAYVNAEPERLRELLRLAAGKPHLAIAPVLDPPEFDEIRAHLARTWQELRACWTAQSGEVIAAIEGADNWARGNAVIGKVERRPALLAAARTCMEEACWTKEDIGDLLKLAQRSLASVTRKGFRTPEHEFFSLCEELKGELASYGALAPAHFLHWATGELARRKTRQNILCFDDLLTILREALAGPGAEALATALRSRFRAVLVDEAQDTDGIQEELFRSVFGGGESRLFFIGDPKQAIYAFRGADVFSYLQATRHATHRYTLGTNRRSEKALVDGVNALFSRRLDPFVIDGIEFTSAAAGGGRDEEALTLDGAPEPPLRIWEQAWEDKPMATRDLHAAVPRATAAAVAALLSREYRIGNRRLSPADIAVLVRSHAQAEAVQGALRELAIPSVLLARQDVFKTREAQELHAVLAAMAEPSRERLVRAALATGLLGVTAQELDGFEQQAGAWEEHVRRFVRHRELWQLSGVGPMLRSFLLETQARSRLLGHVDGDRRLTNILHLSELLQAAEADGRLGPGALVRWLAAARVEDRPEREETILRLERDDEAVQVVTVHASKGLEWEVVLCPYTWMSRMRRQEQPLLYHDPHNGDRLTLDLSVEPAAAVKECADREALAEEVRLLYVALTRARRQCHLLWTRAAFHDDAALHWLLQPGGERRAYAEERAVLAHLQESAPHAIEIVPMPGHDSGCTPALPAAAPWLGPRRFTGAIEQDWGISSFSSLVAAAEGLDVPDYDVAAAAGAAEDDEPAQGIHAFPAGARTGLLVHEILEELDFQSPTELQALVQRKLDSHSAGSEWGDILASGVQRLLDANLPGGVRLSSVAAADRLAELEFYLPAERLTPAMLQAFADDDRGRALNFPARRGWVRGFIDLVFRSGGKFYLADWKSNRLGSRSEAYAPAELARAMAHHRYFLQLHLYTLATHRYLRHRLPGYDYDRDFGGAYYLFLRGIEPEQPELGVVHFRPEKAVIERLDWEFAGELEKEL